MSLSRGGWLEDVGLVEKYEISEEDYYKRENNFRKYKEEKLRADPTWSIKKQMAIQRGQEYMPPEVTCTITYT
jgi:tubulin-folding cofactor B